MNDNKNQLTTQVRAVELIKQNIAKVNALLPSDVKQADFVNATCHALMLADIEKYNAGDVFGCCLEAARAGLVPDKKEGALVPFKGKISFMPMVAGILKVGQKCGVKKWIARVLYENDNFDFTIGEDGEEKIVWSMAKGERGKAIGAFSVATMDDGTTHHEYMPEAEIMKVKNAGSSSGGVWDTWADEMWRKSVIKRAWKYLPLASGKERMQRIIDVDNDAMGFNGMRDITPKPPKPAQKQAERLGVGSANDANDNNDNSGASGGAMSGFDNGGNNNNNNNGKGDNND